MTRRLRLLGPGDTPPEGDRQQGPPDTPECPEDASDDVREVWAYTLEQLNALGIAYPADRDALRCYCEAVVTHRKASTVLARSPVMIPGAIKGTIVANPAIRIQRDAAAQVRAFAEDFGLTPSARLKLRDDGEQLDNGDGLPMPMLYE